MRDEQHVKKKALYAEVNRGFKACAQKDALRAEVFRRSAAERLLVLNASATAPPKGQCPHDVITRSRLALTTPGTPDECDTCEVNMQGGEVTIISVVTVQGGKVKAISEDMKVREEQQPLQQLQQPRPQQQQQEQVGS